MKTRLRPARRDSGGKWRGWVPLMILLILAALAVLASFLLNSDRWNRLGNAMLPVSLHSNLKADYSADPFTTRIPAVSFNLIEDALRDQPTPEPSERYATVVGNLLTPVPTVTPYPTQGIFPTLALRTPSATLMVSLTASWTTTVTFTPDGSLTYTNTPLFWHPTQTMTPTPKPGTPSVTLAPTRTPTCTKTPTHTAVPTKTPTHTPQPTLTPTDIPYPPPPDPTIPAYP